jgi:hypothetical protein
MPRSSSSSSSKSIAPYRPSPAPAPVVHHAVERPTLGQSIKDGVGLGIGSGLGHALVNRMFGIGAPTNQIHPAPFTPTNAKEPCEAERKSFETCLLNNSDVCYNQQTALTQCLQLSKGSK